MSAMWTSFLGGLLGALLGATATLLVGEGKRRRDEDTALLGWCTQVYDWVVDGKVSPDAARHMLEERRITAHWWTFNRRYAARADAILDELDRAFTPPEPPGDGAREKFVLGQEEGD
ncbi:hypothetical protein [Pseudonocardia sp. H11422]|uniref:hypothetical protein n=1 Tax=Pseudonocardia sp. H11422 TaxID=2835866 RepID=UPI001BDC63B3|nr:hypothetical protein [Pseudonocardia sp. H11422]